MIQFAAYTHEDDGWGRHAHNLARALNRYERTILVPPGRRENAVRALFERLRPSWVNSVGIALGNVEYTFALGTRYRVPYHIGETTQVPRHLLFFLQRAEMVWAASHWGKQVLEANEIAPEKIRIVPEGVDTSVFVPQPASQKPSGVFRFLCVGKWEERKSSADLVRAFSQEFQRHEPVELIMHCGGPGVRMSEARSEIAAEVARHEGPPVVLSEPVDLTDLVALMQRSHAFVLPTRGEAWGLPVLEAMACELPCIVTNYSGVQEYANEENCFLLRVRAMCRVDDPKFYDARYEWGEWAEPDFAHLRHLMRFVYENREAAAAKARRARDEAVRLWSWDRAAQSAMAHVTELRASGPTALRSVPSAAARPMTAPRTRLLLFYNHFWDVDPASNPPVDCLEGWELTSDPSRFEEASAVVFHVPTVPTWAHLKKHPHQRWVAWSSESDVNYPQLANAGFMARFDLTMTYRLDSDVPVLYVDPDVANQMRRPPVSKTTEAVAVLFTSNTRERSGRSSYLADLMEYIPVHSYGRWKRNRIIEPDTGRETKLDTIARYKFTLAFENSIAEHYVSEKFFDPLIAGSVPVYQGTPNIDDFAPADQCFINVDDFRGPRELADYLQMLDADPARYQAYLEWKDRPFRNGFLDLVESQSMDYRCRLCRRLEALG